jgi:Mlc titration factor MtfA (ptsG expression regulator)
MEVIMGLPNRVSATLSDEDKAAVIAALATIKSKLPFLISLTTDEKKRLPRIDEGSQPWSEKMLTVATQHPDFLPGGFKTEEMRKDVTLWKDFIPVYQEITSLAQLVDNTYLAIAVDAYSAALAVYTFGSKSDVATEGLEDLMDELGKRFARKSGKASPGAQTPQK